MNQRTRAWYDAVQRIIAAHFDGMRLYPVTVSWAREEPDCLIVRPTWRGGTMERIGFALRVDELTSMTAQCAAIAINHAIRHALIDALNDQWNQGAVVDPLGRRVSP